MQTDLAQAAAKARELEADLDDYPEERGQILVEAGESWHRAGDHDRAIELLNEAVPLGGEDGGNARVALADILFDLGRTDEARAQLDALRAQRPLPLMPCHMAAELLAERAEHQEALTWYNMAVARLTDQEREALDEETGFVSFANLLLRGRKDMRQALGMPPDDLDNSVHEFDPDLFADLTKRVAHGSRPPGEVRVLFWPRAEVAHAHQRWPQIVQHADADTVIRDREAANRELSESGVARITLVPLTAAKLAEFADRTGGDPADEKTRHACMAEIVADGGVINWPPARNASCWCGTTVKYKKCCGRPITGDQTHHGE